MQKSSPHALRGLVMIEVLVATAVAGVLVSGLFDIVGDYTYLAKRGEAVIGATIVVQRLTTYLDKQSGSGTDSGYSWRLVRSHSPVAVNEIRRGFRLVREEIRIVGPGLSNPVTHRRERLVR